MIGKPRRYGVGTSAGLRGLSHAIAPTHIISNKQASPKTLAKSTAIGPKAMRNSNGFMRIGIRPPRSSLTMTNHRHMCKGLLRMLDLGVQ